VICLINIQSAPDVTKDGCILALRACSLSCSGDCQTSMPQSTNRSTPSGLGKTLQVLATSWTLMQRGGPKGRPAVRKMLVVAPSSVIKNWGQEIHKWLGMERAAYLVLLPGKEAAGQVRAEPAASGDFF
jgi:SNF2 family DNA or RNA helicase